MARDESPPPVQPLQTQTGIIRRRRGRLSYTMHHLFFFGRFNAADE